MNADIEDLEKGIALLEQIELVKADGSLERIRKQTEFFAEGMLLLATFIKENPDSHHLSRAKNIRLAYTRKMLNFFPASAWNDPEMLMRYLACSDIARHELRTLRKEDSSIAQFDRSFWNAISNNPHPVTEEGDAFYQKYENILRAELKSSEAKDNEK